MAVGRPCEALSQSVSPAGYATVVMLTTHYLPAARLLERKKPVNVYLTRDCDYPPVLWHAVCYQGDSALARFAISRYKAQIPFPSLKA